MRLTIFIIFSFLAFQSYGQIMQPGRFEIELDNFEDGYSVLSGHDAGVLLYKPLDVYNGRYSLWRFIKLDTALNSEWVKEIYLDRANAFRGYAYAANNYSFLFQGTSRSSLDLLLVQMDEFNGDTTQHRIRNLVNINLLEFEMTKEAAIIGGAYNEDPVVIHYSLKTEKSKVLPGIFGNKTQLAQIKVTDNSIKVLLTTRAFDNNSNTLALKTYDPDGEYLDSYIFDPDEDIGLIFGRVANLGANGSIIVGTYGVRKSDFSRGLFVAQHNTEIEQNLLYYNYADLDNFFTYLKAKRQKRITDKIERKKIKGKKVKFNYRLLVHDIIEDGDTYIMLGEAFYPKYSSSNYMNMSGYGVNGFGSGGSSTLSFEGYRYTHAVIIGFNKQGEVLWDNSFQIDDVVSYNLEQFVHADVNDGKVVLLYAYENEIRSKLIEGSDVIEGKSFDNLRLTFQDDIVNDKSSNSDIAGFEKWYDDKFMAYGVQKIKNLKDTGVKLNRRVFYINKIEYDHSIALKKDENTASENKDTGTNSN